MKKKQSQANNLSIVFLDFDDIKNPLLNAGQARSTYEVGKRLAEKGHDVTVISSRFPGSKDRIEAGIKYRHIGSRSRFIRLNNLIYILLMPLAVRKIRADIILECFTAPISTLFTPLYTKIPVVAKPTSFEAERFARRYLLPFNIIEKLGCRFYKYFIPANDYHEKKMRKYAPNIISRLIPEGVDNEYFNIEKKSPKHILFLGRLDIGQKGIDLLLQAYANVKNNIKWPLVIAGNGPDEEKTKNLINKLGLNSRVSMIGPAYGEKKNHVIAETLFVALPSRHEGFCLFALEALAAGIPLAAFDIPGISWINSAAARKATPFNTREYAETLVKLSNNSELLDKMGLAAEELAEKFTWEKTAQKYDNFFREIIKNEYE